MRIKKEEKILNSENKNVSVFFKDLFFCETQNYTSATHPILTRPCNNLFLFPQLRNHLNSKRKKKEREKLQRVIRPIEN